MCRRGLLPPMPSVLFWEAACPDPPENDPGDLDSLAHSCCTWRPGLREMVEAPCAQKVSRTRSGTAHCDMLTAKHRTRCMPRQPYAHARLHKGKQDPTRCDPRWESQMPAPCEGLSRPSTHEDIGTFSEAQRVGLTDGRYAKKQRHKNKTNT